MTMSNGVGCDWRNNELDSDPDLEWKVSGSRFLSYAVRLLLVYA